jgi:integrase/recombinase XerD
MLDYIAYLQNDSKDPKTIEAYSKSVVEFQKWYSDTTGQEFDPQIITSLDIKDYISWLATSQKQSPRTINKKLGGLKNYFNYLIDEEIITANPTAKVKSKKISSLQQSPRWLTRHEQARLLHCIEKNKNTKKRARDYAIAQLMLQAGLRVIEVASLNIDDIDLRRNTLTIREGKGGKMAILPINKDLHKSLADYIELRESHKDALFISGKGDRLTDRGIQHQFRKYFDQINLPDTTVHSLRHSFCKNLLDQGVDLTVVAQLARHESLDTTRRYVTPGERDLRLAVEKINWED